MQHALVEDYTIALSESNLWLSMQSTEQFNRWQVLVFSALKCHNIVAYAIARPSCATIPVF